MCYHAIDAILIEHAAAHTITVVGAWAGLIMSTETSLHKKISKRNLADVGMKQ